MNTKPPVRRLIGSCMKKLLLPTLAAAVLTILSTGCVVHETRYVQAPPPGPTGAPPGTEVVVSEAPPAPIVEYETVSPGPAFVWIPGVWVWQGHWVWAGGHWAHRPHRGAVYVAPHYVYRNGSHIWISGGWRS
jgi:hypothetical protein